MTPTDDDGFKVIPDDPIQRWRLRALHWMRSPRSWKAVPILLFLFIIPAAILLWLTPPRNQVDEDNHYWVVPVVCIGLFVTMTGTVGLAKWLVDRPANAQQMDQLAAGLPEHLVSASLVPETGSPRMALASGIFWLIPILGLLIALGAVISNKRVGNWQTKVSAVALIASILVSLTFFIIVLTCAPRGA